MLWLPLALASYIFWGIGNILDKYLLSHYFKNPYVFGVLPCLFGGFGVVAAFFVNFYFFDFNTTALVALAAFMFFVASIIYCKVLSKEDVSRVAVLLDFICVITLVLAWIFIDEKLNTQQFIAFFLIFLGGIVVSFKINNKKIKLSSVWLYMLIACLAYAIHDVIIRYLTFTKGESTSVIFIYTTFFLSLFSSFLFFSKHFRSEWRKDFKNATPTALILVLLLVVGYRLALLFYTKAVALGPVAIINATQGFQTIVSFVLVFIILKIKPSFIKEDLSRGNFIAKFVGLVFMVIGVALLNL